jgi:hypothetical protein
MITIPESGMTFGPYQEDKCFCVENSATYKKMEGITIAEFMLLQSQKGRPVIWIVEAKSSSPRPVPAEKFDNFIDEIRQKLINAMSLWFAAKLQRHPSMNDELSDDFKSLDLSTVDFRLILVINGHQESWLPPLQEALRKALHATVKTWALSPSAVVVMNHELAYQSQLISAPVPG